MKLKCVDPARPRLFGKPVLDIGLTKDKVYDGQIVMDDGRIIAVIFNDHNQWQRYEPERFAYLDVGNKCCACKC